MLFFECLRIRADNWSFELWAEIFLIKCNKEREQCKWKRSRTLESSLCVPVCWVTNRPLGLRLALITPCRSHYSFFFVFVPTFHPHKLSLTALFCCSSVLSAICCLCSSMLLCRIQHRAAVNSLLSNCQPLISILKWWSIFKNQLALTFFLWIKASSFLTLIFYTDR